MAKKRKKETCEECNCKKSSGLFIPAGLFVGMGVGFAVNNFVAWMFIGLGAGFVAMLIARSCCKCNCK